MARASKQQATEAANANAHKAQAPQKRKRAPLVSTASTLQAKTLYASTRDEVREIQVCMARLLLLWWWCGWSHNGVVASCVYCSVA